MHTRGRGRPTGAPGRLDEERRISPTASRAHPRRRVCHAWPGSAGQACLHAPPLSLPVARRVTLPTSPAARSPTLLLVFRALSNNHASRPRRAPPETPFPTPARICRARISHVSIFQNMGSAHAIPPKTPRNPTAGCAHTTRVFSTYFAFFPAVSVLAGLVSTPQFGSTTISPLSRNPVATRRATNPRRTKGTASIQSWCRDARHRRAVPGRITVRIYD
jgi:hypothetical protein